MHAYDNNCVYANLCTIELNVALILQLTKMSAVVADLSLRGAVGDPEILQEKS